MDLTAILTSSFGTVLLYALPFLAVLTVIVFIHELGHFLVARWCRVNVEVFSVGFGRAIAGWTDKHGTYWKIGWAPLGGYVKFEGDANATSLPEAEDASAPPPSEGSFHHKPVGQRAAVVVAGPVANFLLAIVIFAGLFTFVGVPFSKPLVQAITEGSAAEVAGVKVGDEIRAIDGRRTESFNDVQNYVRPRAGDEITIDVFRDGQIISLNAIPESTEVTVSGGRKVRIGLLGIKGGPVNATTYVKKSPVEALALGVERTWMVVETTMHYLSKLVTGRESFDQLSGVPGIARITAQAFQLGIYELFQIGAVLSVSIGLLNLFPIPMLDGGHLLYYLIESVRGKPLGQEIQEFGFKIGLALVLSLMVFATWNDIVNW